MQQPFPFAGNAAAYSNEQQRAAGHPAAGYGLEYWQQAQRNEATAGDREEEGFIQSLLEAIKRPLLYSVGAYSDENEFDKLPGIFKCKRLEIKTPRGMSDTHAFVCILHPVPQTTLEPVHVAFVYKGTEPWELQDITSDLAFTARDIEWFHGKAHGGFLEVFNNSRTGAPDGIAANMHDLLMEVGGGCVHPNGEPRTPTRVLCCGHSLGGAAATLSAAWCKKWKYPDAYVRCITLGSPRVGDKRFVEEFDRLMAAQEQRFHAQELSGGMDLARLHKEPAYRHSMKAALDDYRLSLRIVHALDVVPSLPPIAWRFAHVGNPVWLERVINNWGMDIVVWVGKDRPLHQTGWMADHFEWKYRAARDIALATPVLAGAPPDTGFLNFVEAVLEQLSIAIGMLAAVMASGTVMGRLSGMLGLAQAAALYMLNTMAVPARRAAHRVLVTVLQLAQGAAQRLLWALNFIPSGWFGLRSSVIVWLMTTFIVLPMLFMAVVAGCGACILVANFCFWLFPFVAVFMPPVARLLVFGLSRVIKLLTSQACRLGL